MFEQEVMVSREISVLSLLGLKGLTGRGKAQQTKEFWISLIADQLHLFKICHSENN